MSKSDRESFTVDSSEVGTIPQELLEELDLEVELDSFLGTVSDELREAAIEMDKAISSSDPHRILAAAHNIKRLRGY